MEMYLLTSVALLVLSLLVLAGIGIENYLIKRHRQKHAHR